MRHTPPYRLWTIRYQQWFNSLIGDRLALDQLRWLPFAIGGGVAVTGITVALQLRQLEQERLHSTIQIQVEQLADKLTSLWQNRLLTVQHIGSMSARQHNALSEAQYHHDSEILFGPFPDTIALAKLDREGNLQHVITHSEGDRGSVESTIQSPDIAKLVRDREPQNAILKRHEEWMLAYSPIVKDGTYSGALIAVFDYRSLLEKTFSLTSLESLAVVTITCNGKPFWSNGQTTATDELPIEEKFGYAKHTFGITALPQQSTFLSWHYGSFIVGGGSLTFGAILAGMLALWQTSYRRYRRATDINQQLDVEIEAHKQARVELTKRKKQLRMVLDNSLASIFQKDSELRYVLVNRHFANLCGLEIHQLLGKRDTDLFPAEIAEPLENNDRQVLNSKQAHCFEEELMFTGNQRTHLTSISPLTGEKEEVYGICGVSIDVSERKLVENRLQAAYKQLDLQFDCAPIAIIEWDAQCRITRWSRQAEHLFGWTSEEQMGRQWGDSHLHLSEETVQVNRILQRLLSGTEDTVVKTQSNITKSGKVLLCEWHHSVLRDDSGQVVSLLSMGLDITARHQATLALQASEKGLRQLTENIREVFWISDPQSHKTLFVSPAYEEIWGRQREELLNNPDSLIQSIHPDDRQAILDSYFLQKQAGQETEAEYRIVKPNGKIRWIRDRAFPVYGGSGELLRVVGLAEDVTETKQAKIALQRKKRQQKLIAIIGQHIRRSLDVNTILQSTVEEVRQILKCDRAIIYEFDSDWNGTIAMESVDVGVTSLLGKTVEDTCLAQTSCLYAYANGQRIQAIADIFEAGLDDCYLKLLASCEVRANLVVPIVFERELWGLLIAQHCRAPRHWEDSEVDLLKQIANQAGIAIQHSQLLAQAQQQAQQQLLLNQLIRNIRDSLDRSTVLQQAADSLRIALNASRCCISLCNPEDAFFTVEYSSNALGILDIRGRSVPIAGNPHTQKVINSDAVVAVDDVNQSDLMQGKGREAAHQLEIGAIIATAVRTEQQFIGVISVHRTNPHRWADRELSLLKQVADQLAVAINQATLYDRVQTLNEQLEQKVEQRTAQVSQALKYEATLNRITDKVRESLDEEQILQVALQELTSVLDLLYCDTAAFDNEAKVAQLSHEYSSLDASFSQAVGQTVLMEDFPDRFKQIYNREPFQFCELKPSFNRPHASILSLPIADNQEVLGDIWAFRTSDRSFTNQEVRIAQQVANQCAIAIRQARLYKAAQARVEELDRLHLMKDDFLSTVSHELRSPVANIKLSLDILQVALDKMKQASDAKEHDRMEKKVQKYLEVLNIECDREISLIKDLLDLQRLEAGTETLEWEFVNLKSWLPHIILPFVERAKQNNQTLAYDFPSNIDGIVTDMSSLQRILTELLTNACKYTPPKESIIVKVCSHDERFTFQITNTGVEIPERELPLVFDKFYRIVEVDRWKQGGTGLGLALIKRLTEEIGGAIRACSSDNQTTFIIELPNRIDMLVSQPAVLAG